MLSHRFYYALKPFVPWEIRMGVRRIFARRKRVPYRKVWPIDPSAATPPPNWPGWPDGKKFAFVLTHDVEGPEGVAKCRRLAELEMEMGFRSCFNFIPEGSYDVPAELRAWLLENGFEVGVHDLHHDGRLFASREGFVRKAARINQYTQTWGATGFRAGFMLRNLEWLHDLETRYDCSTFDTDPFEPQSDGAGTIFPHWMAPPPGHKGQGYVELPYTLPQDSTLFLLLREKTPEIWLNKLDWVASKGGMALVNVHPDYVCFEGERPGHRTFPVAHYRALLSHLRQQYAGTCWETLPGRIAERYREPLRAGAPTPRPLAGKRAAVLLYSYYPADPRPRRAAEALVEAGAEVELLCLSESEADAPRERIRGVNVIRLPMKRLRGSKFAYLWQYGRFLLSSFWFLTRSGLMKKYDLVHVHNMPDFLVFAAVLPKLRGARVILDLHDPMPELMMSIYGLESDRWAVRLLRALERWSIGFANLVLTPNIAFKDLFVSRSCPPGKIEIVMNSPQIEIFDPARVPDHPPAPNNGRFRVMHHGLIAHRHGVDQLVEAIARLRPVIPGIQLDIYGSRTAFLDVVLETAQKLGCSDIVHYHGTRSQAEIATAILECDVGVVPNRRSLFTELNFPTRLFEYMAMRRLVIAPSTKGIRDYFSDRQVVFFEPGNVDDLAARLRWVWEHPAESREIVAQGLQVYEHHLWPEEKKRFHALVSRLLSKP